MNEEAQKQTVSTSDVGERAEELASEFSEHLSGFKAEHPELEPIDEGRVAEAWAIQKIAGLQVLVENLYREPPLPLRLPTPLRAL